MISYEQKRKKRPQNTGALLFFSALFARNGKAIFDTKRNQNSNKMEKTVGFPPQNCIAKEKDEGSTLVLTLKNLIFVRGCAERRHSFCCSFVFSRWARRILSRIFRSPTERRTCVRRREETEKANKNSNKMEKTVGFPP